jgi:hypothetical protein
MPSFQALSSKERGARRFCIEAPVEGATRRRVIVAGPHETIPRDLGEIHGTKVLESQSRQLLDIIHQWSDHLLSMIYH